MRLKEKYDYMIAYFSEHLPDAATELHYSNDYELLVAVILSAQCTDKRVNQVTPALWQRFPDIGRLAKGSVTEVFSYIKSISYPNNKAKHLVGMAQKVLSEYGGVIPVTVAALMQLPGVGRKTANVLTSVLHEQPNMAVDTHVFRVSHRLGLVRASDNNPLKVEQKLIRYLPVALVHKAHHWLILHGRYTCVSRRPQCEQCGLRAICAMYAATQKSLV